MSNPCLPPEILDCIVDLLHNIPYALNQCCLVSKSWTPRARRHLFAKIGLATKERVELWKKAFPDPSTSPARYANTLYIGCLHVVTAADTEAGGWIRGFSRVVNLELDTQRACFDELAIVLVTFQGLSPFVKSLRVGFVSLPPPQVFDLILSFPLLEDLALISSDTPIENRYSPGRLPTIIRLSNPLAFAGSLELPLVEGMRPTVGRLSTLPVGPRFRNLVLGWYREEDLLLVTALMEEFSHTLESLDVIRCIHGGHDHLTPTH